MKFANVPEELLRLELGEAYDMQKGWYKWTLQSELEAVGEDLVAVDWKASANQPFQLLHFHGWTENYIVFLTETVFGDQVIEKIPRNPQGE